MPYQHIRKLCDEIIAEGMEKLGMTMGIVSRIKQDLYEIVAVSSKPVVFVVGESFQLKDTFCREVVEKGATIALTEQGGVPGLCLHPLYSEGAALEAYISTPLYYNGEIWGTLNFSSLEIKSHSFNDEDIEYIKRKAAIISATI